MIYNGQSKTPQVLEVEMRDKESRKLIRLFIAAEVPEARKRQILRIQEQLRKICSRATYTKSENLHMTLKFIGEVEASEKAKFCSLLRGLDCAVHYTLRCRKLTAVPGRDGELIRLDLEAEDSVLALAQEIDRACQKVGIPREKRAFLPHITLARRAVRTKAIEEIFLPEISIEFSRVVLFRSEFTSSGMRYTPLCDHPSLATHATDASL